MSTFPTKFAKKNAHVGRAAVSGGWRQGAGGPICCLVAVIGCARAQECVRRAAHRRRHLQLPAGPCQAGHWHRRPVRHVCPNSMAVRVVYYRRVTTPMSYDGHMHCAMVPDMQSKMTFESFENKELSWPSWFMAPPPASTHNPASVMSSAGQRCRIPFSC